MFFKVDLGGDNLQTSNRAGLSPPGVETSTIVSGALKPKEAAP